jgi:PAS domain S-box-containing protein
MIIESTASELRETGISVIGDVPWGTHFCYFYETKEDLLETQVLYFKAGLENKEFCVWVVSQALSVEEAKQALGQAVPDLELHLAEGALEIHSHDEWYLRDRRWDSQRVLRSWREKLDQGLAKSYAGLRAAGDGGWVQNDDWMAFREYEEQVNAMIAEQRSIILCTYPLTTSQGNQVFDVAHIHQMAVARRNGSWETIEIPALKEAKAEIKRINEELEQKVEERTRELAAANAALRAEIVERRLAEEAVKQAEDRIRLIIDTIPTMAWSLNPDGVVDFVNQRWIDYTGLSFEHAIRKPNGVVHPEDLPRVMEKWRGDIAAGELCEDEMRLRRADGEYHWFLVRTEPLHDEHGNIIKWYGVSTDIGDRKRAEKKLLQSERQLAEAQRLAHIGSWDWDLRTNAVTWSEELYHIFGLQLGTISVAGQVDRFIHPDDLDLGWDTVKRAVANKEPYDYYHRILRPDGTERIARSRGSIISDERGEPIRVFGATQDVTELKRAEEKLKETGEQLRTLIDAIPQQIWSAPPDGKTDYCNDRWRSYTGLELEDLRGYGWKAMLHPDDQDLVLKAWHESVAKGTLYEQEERHRGSDGTYRWFLSLAVPLRDAEGRIVRWYGTNTDIEDRKRAEEALHKSEKLFAAFMDHLPGFAWMKDIEGRYLWVNKKESELDVYHDGAIGKTDADLWPAEIASAYQANDLQVIATRKAVQTVEPSLVSGEPSSMIVCKFPILDPDGSVVMVAGVGVDVTDRERAEEKLWHSLNLLRAITEGTIDAIYAKDREGRYLMINTAGARFEDKTPEEVIGLDDTRLFSGETLAKIIERDRAILKTGETRTDEDITTTPDGLTRVHLTTKGPLRDSAGEIIGLFGVSRDITENKRAEQALRESEQRFRELAENINEVFWLSDDKNARMHYISSAYERVWGRSCASLYAAPRSWMDAVHPEDKEQVLATVAKRSLNEAYHNTYRIVRPDGSIRWIRDRGFPVRDERGVAVRFAGIAEDITERKRTEQARERVLSLMLATLESTADGILVVNTEGKIETFNRLFARMWRLPDEVLASKEDALALECVLEQLVEPEKFLENVRYLYQHPEVESFDRLVFKDGRVFERYSRPQLIGGKVAGRVWSFRNVTERKRAAKELEAANYQLRVLSRQLFHIQEEERRHLARELHDEIGQTLTAAKINLKIIAPDVPANVVGRLDDSIQLLDRLLRQVRQLSLDLRPPLLDELGLVPTLRWLVDQQGQRAQLRATFTANINGLEIDPAVQTTCFRVAQEAITNIIRHSGAKSVAVQLRREAERLWLSVRDDGAGFDPSVIQKGAGQHSSLGLVSMKERTLLVRGGFEVHSVPGQGTEIRAWFPLAPREHPSAETK